VFFFFLFFCVIFLSQYTHKQVCLKRFLTLHGLIMLRAWLLEFKEKRPIYTAILDLLGKLPIQYKNQIERSKIGLTVKLFEANDDPEVVNTCRVVSSFSSSSWPSWKNQQNLLSFFPFLTAP